MSGAEPVLNLAAPCPCGHTANWHRTEEQQRAYLKASDGRYVAECTYFMGINQPCCRCTTTQERVSAYSEREAKA